MKKKRQEATSPFLLDAAAEGTLSDQLAENIRRAIVNGYFRPGDKLPGIRQIAEKSGTSLAVPRAALAKLQESGDVRARSGAGCIVLARNRRIWKGRILLVCTGSSASYSRDAFLRELTKILSGAGYHVEWVMLTEVREGRLRHDTQLLKQSLNAGCSLAISYSASEQIVRLLQASGMPYVVGAQVPLKGHCVGAMFVTCERAFAQFAEHCRETGVRRVLQVDYPDCPFGAERALKAVGVSVERLTVRPEVKTRDALQNFERCGYEGVRERMKNVRRARPDLVYFADDFLAIGGLLALAELDVDVPQDVKVVSVTNRGITPVSSRPLARIECDPYENADRVARFVIRHLEQDARRASIPLPFAYVRGETF